MAKTGPCNDTMYIVWIGTVICAMLIKNERVGGAIIVWAIIIIMVSNQHAMQTLSVVFDYLLLYACAFVFIEIVSGVSCVIVVTPHTRLAGADCEPRLEKWIQYQSQCSSLLIKPVVNLWVLHEYTYVVVNE